MSSSTTAIEDIFLELDDILGPPPLLADEDRVAYKRLRDLFRKAIAPTDCIEALWVRELTDLTWEGLRYRRWKSAYHRYAEKHGANSILQQVNGYSLEAQQFAASLASGSRKATAEFAKTMKGAGYDKDVLAAVAFSSRRDQFEFFERMIAGVEARYLRIIREIERRRESLSRRLREIVDTANVAEDAEIVGADTSPLRTDTDTTKSRPRRKRAKAQVKDPSTEIAAENNSVDDPVADSCTAAPPWHDGQF